MVKRVFFAIACLSMQLSAMEGDKPKRAYIKLQNIHGQLEVIAPKSRDAVDKLREEKMVAEQATQWTEFIKEAKLLLETGSVEQANPFFSRINCFANTPYYEVRGAQCVLLLNQEEEALLGMAQFFNPWRLKKDLPLRVGVLKLLHLCKKSIDNDSLERMTFQTERVVNCLCNNLAWYYTTACPMPDALSMVRMEREMVGACCKEKVSLGVTCPSCALRLRKILYGHLAQKVCAFGHFGLLFATDKDQALHTWAQDLLDQHAKIDAELHAITTGLCEVTTDLTSLVKTKR